MPDRIIGYFSDEDRSAVCCNDCAGQVDQAGDPVHQTDNPIPADFDGADQFRCEHCGRLLVEVTP